ncbi:MAG: hypothetical protein OXB99_03890 [Acidimicrobiaceae bacterium]|nr:hypothetical protein [Acidimicrobiaceae bacterium]
MSALRGLPAEPHEGRGGGLRLPAWWTLAVVLAVLPLAVMAARSEAAGAQTSVTPVLSCGGMVLDSGSGTCLTPRTETVLRPSGCPAGSTKAAGQYGGHVCQTKVTRKVETGRTKQVYSRTTYDRVWMPTGTKRVQTGTNRVWVPPSTMVEPLVPPVRVQVGTRTSSKTVTRPGPEVLYKVSYKVTVRTERVVRRCAFDPIAGRRCWNETVGGKRTETRTRLECCIAGPPITRTITTKVPVYSYRTSMTVTVPGYWSETPVYDVVETGYWDRVPTIHYTTVPVYETVVEWVTAAATQGPCPAGWRSAGSQCSRTVLGPPSAAPAQSCPSGTTPRYGDALGGTGPSVLTCQSNAPGSDTDTGTEQEDSGGSETSPDGGARPLHHLAGESDERLAELGIHRCADGLLSYVPCDELPGRTWESDSDVCDGIDGTTYRPDHGGSCVTESDLLNKCTTPGDCEETTVRTYCPAIGELADTQIQEHAHPGRGAETYRVCVFDCASFGTLPPYVQTRINGSYDYACLPVPEPEEEPSPTTTSTIPTTTTTTEPGEDDGDDDGDDDDDPGDPPDVTGPDTTRPDTTRPDTTGPDTTEPDTTGPDTTEPDTTEPDTTGPPGDRCAPVPPATAVADALAWESRVRSTAAADAAQRDMPGGGRFLQVAPGRGWMSAARASEITDANCTWVATHVRTAWSELRPWEPPERRAMMADDDTRRLVQRWDALSAEHRRLTSQWHRPGAVPSDIVCTVGDASGPGASAACGWVLARPAAYAWRAAMCFEPQTSPGRSRPGSPNRSEPAADDPCWVRLGSGVDWIRSVGDYADGRVTLTQSGNGS